MIAEIQALADALALTVPAQLTKLAAYTNQTHNPAIDPARIRPLLLNSWSAEYALRMVPDDSGEFAAKSFPTVYYAPLFSARAFIYAMTALIIPTEADAPAAIRSFDDCYPACLFEKDQSWFDLIGLFRMTAASEDQITASITALTPADLQAFHQALVTLVNLLNLVHEAYIRRTLGPDVYRQLAGSMPLYLQEYFVEERLEQLLRTETGLITYQA